MSKLDHRDFLTPLTPDIAICHLKRTVSERSRATVGTPTYSGSSLNLHSFYSRAALRRLVSPNSREKHSSGRHGPGYVKKRETRSFQNSRPDRLAPQGDKENTQTTDSPLESAFDNPNEIRTGRAGVAHRPALLTRQNHPKSLAFSEGSNSVGQFVKGIRRRCFSAGMLEELVRSRTARRVGDRLKLRATRRQSRRDGLDPLRSESSQLLSKSGNRIAWIIFSHRLGALSPKTSGNHRG